METAVVAKMFGKMFCTFFATLTVSYCIGTAQNKEEASFIHAKSPESCNRLQKNAFYVATGGMLRGFAYNIRRALSTASCVRDCMLDPRCVSINYYLGSENRCELNNATKSQFPGNFSKLQLGSVYFDNNSSTMFSLASVPCGELMTTPA